MHRFPSPLSQDGFVSGCKHWGGVFVSRIKTHTSCSFPSWKPANKNKIFYCVSFATALKKLASTAKVIFPEPEAIKFRKIVQLISPFGNQQTYRNLMCQCNRMDASWNTVGGGAMGATFKTENKMTTIS